MSISLQTPVKLGSLQLKNRVIMASLTRSRSPNSFPNEVNVEYYAQRASAGLILSEATLISPQGYEFTHAPGIWSKRHAQAWKKVTDAVHAKDGLIFCQSFHVGRVAHPVLQAGQPNVGPSAVKAAGGKFRQVSGEPGYCTPEAIPTDEIDMYVEMFRNAAVQAKAAGFDGIELHAANGYLVAQFLCAKANIRTDEFGGSPENRCRFPLLALDALISVFGADRVGVKITPSGGYNDIGGGLEEDTKTFTHFVSEMNKRNIAYLQFSRYSPLFDPEGRGNPIQPETFRKLFKGTFLLNFGYERDTGDAALAAGEGDAIVYGRHFIANPDLPRRFFENLPLAEFAWPDCYGPHTATDTEEYRKAQIQGYTTHPALIKQ